MFFVLGVLVAFLAPTEYESDAVLLIENINDGSNANQLLREYGGFLGLGGSLNTSKGLTPDIYPKIIEGLPFQLSLVRSEIKFNKPDTVINVFKYFNTLHPPSALELIYGYTIGLPGKIKNLFVTNSSEINDTSPVQEVTSNSGSTYTSRQIFNVASDTLGTIGELKSRVFISVGADGLLEVSAKMPDPYAAASLGENTITLLKEYIKDYRTKKASENLKYAEAQLKSAKEKFEIAQRRLAEFRDSNVNLATAKAETRLQQLQSEYDLTFGIYNSLATRVEELKLQVQEETPVFSTLHPFKVPKGPSEPKIKLIILASFLVGLIAGLGIVVVNEVWRNFQR